MENSIKENDSLTKINELTKKDYNEFEIIMSIYQKALNNTIKECVEIQIRTALMDFWSTIEHKIKYKPKSKLSNSDSIKLSIYARIINDISDKMMKIHRKQTKLLR